VTAWSIIITLAITINLIWVEANSKSLAIGWVISGTASLIIASLIFTLFNLPPWLSYLNLKSQPFYIALIPGVIFPILILALGCYIGWLAMMNDQRFTSIRQIAIAFAARAGTTFQGADLSHTNFTEATLKAVDFKGANLTGTCWFHAQNLDSANVENTYLQFPQVQKLVVTGIGENKNFDHFDLQGINLKNAYLADASFIGTNLNQANLQNVYLSRAKLIGTKLDQANVSGAYLTGAYIQSCQISDSTQLTSIECDYIFTQIPTEEQPSPQRIPTNQRQTFAPGEFVKLLRQFEAS